MPCAQAERVFLHLLHQVDGPCPVPSRFCAHTQSWADSCCFRSNNWKESEQKQRSLLGNVRCARSSYFFLSPGWEIICLFLRACCAFWGRWQSLWKKPCFSGVMSWGFREWTVWCVMGSQDHVTFMLVSAVRFVLPALPSPISSLSPPQGFTAGRGEARDPSRGGRSFLCAGGQGKLLNCTKKEK